MRRIAIKFVLPAFILVAGNSIFAQAPDPYNPATIKINYIRSWDALAPEQNENTLMLRPVKDIRMTTQYMDGLGRPLQIVVKKGSMETGSAPTDLVSATMYDEFGREQHKYLPFAANNTSGNSSITDGLFKLNPFQQQATFMNAQFGSQGESYFYSKTNFEASPLNRAEKTMSAGNNWAGSNRGVEIKYWANTATDAVRVWKVTGNAGAFGTYAVNTLVNGGVYTAGELYKNVTIDEHGKQVIEFKNKEGKVILKKVQLTAIADNGTGKDHADWLCTYYIYDELNNLRCVIQPEGVKKLAGNGWVIDYTAGQMADEQFFRYEYDNRGRMIMKKVPGAGDIYMVYDAKDRLVMTQDAKMRTQSKWMVTKYDELNRPYETGLWNNNGNSFAQHQTSANSSSNYPVTSSGYEQLSLTHYDDYNSLPAGLSASYISTWNSSLAATNNYQWPYPQMPAQNNAVRGMATWTKVKILGSDPAAYISSVTIYDEKGRAIQVQSTNSTGDIDVVTTQYGWAGQPLVIVQKQQKSGTNAQEHVVVTKMEYDELGRVVKVKKTVNSTVNGVAVNKPEQQVLQNEYDKLGQLKTKKLGANNLETLNYEYNVRGWMLGMNREYAKDNNSSNYFGFDLGYDKTNNGLINNQSYTAAQYNGNIAGMVWKSKGDGEKRKYDFGYDAANRLMKADFTQYTSGAFNQAAGINFDMKMGDGIDVNTAYDYNGNIKQMQQWGLKAIGGSIQVDNLIYKYQNNDATNKLLSVTESIIGTTDNKLGDFTDKNISNDDYAYDVNGNLISDKNKGISSITYNHLNLPSVISINPPAGQTNGSRSITYTYDASGNKLKKVAHESAGPGHWITTTTSYINGFVYESISHGSAVDPNDYTDRLQFIPQEEGRIRFKPATTTEAASFQYDYMLKDHLGNVRMVLTEEQKTDAYPVASLEAITVNTESQFYGGLNNGRQTKPSGYPADTYTTPNDYVQKLSGAGGQQKLGANMVLKVMAGDQFSVRCNSWWNSGNTPGTPQSPLGDLLSAMAGAVGGISGGHGGATATEITNSGVLTPGVTGFLSNQPYNTSRPKAYLNWIFLDEQFKFYSGGSEQVDGSGTFKTHLPPAINAAKNGYLYIYVSNETANIDVFFDNLQVSHARGVILEETHYYPFGLIMSGISSKALVFGNQNKHKFNGGSELQSNEFSEGSGLELFDAVNRMYDPQIGRFLQIDELAEANWGWTPYMYALNNPILYNDPLGLDPEKGLTAETAKELQGVTLITIPKNFWAKQRLYYDVMEQLNRRGASIDQIVQPRIREMMYRFDGITKHRETVATMTRSFDKVLLQVGSFFIPSSWLLKVKYLKYAKNLFNWKRGKVIGKTTEEVTEQVLKHGDEAENGVFIVTKEGVVLPKGAKIPGEYIENVHRSSTYGIIENGKFVEKLRIDPARFAEPSHFHINGKGKKYTTWRWF